MTLKLCTEPGCEVRHIVNCQKCLGFGLTLSGFPIPAFNYVGTGPYLTCPVCGGTPNGLPAATSKGVA